MSDLELTERLSGGETSTVYGGSEAGHSVAVKVLNSHLATDPVIRDRFLREARLMASLRHPNIVRVHNVVELEDRPAMVMELLGGGSLKGHLLDSSGASDLLGKLADALTEIHTRGVVHRDLRPEHILFDSSGEPRIVDFGMASVKDLSGLTRSTVYSARPAFVDPYTFGRGRLSATSDIYSLGAVIFSCVVGTPPGITVFGPTNEGAHERAVERLEETVGPPLSDIVGKMLDAPSRRPRSAAEIVDWLGAGGTRGIRKVTRCLFCGAQMPVEAPLCFECGSAKPEVRLDPEGDILVLKKITEKAEVLGPFLAKLRVLSGSSLDGLKLIIGDPRLYSREEQKSGFKIPVRIADHIHDSSVEGLISALTGDGIQIRRYPASRSSRYKRGPLIQPQETASATGETVSLLRSLGDGSAQSAGLELAAKESIGSSLRDDCRYALSLAIAALSKPETSELVSRERVTEIWALLTGALDSLENMRADLAGTNLQLLYADLERLDTDHSARGDAERKRIRSLFGDYAEAEREAAAMEQKIVRAARVLEQLQPGTAASGLREFEAALA